MSLWSGQAASALPAAADVQDFQGHGCWFHAASCDTGAFEFSLGLLCVPRTHKFETVTETNVISEP